MFDEVLGEITAKLDNRFIMSIFFPTLLFLGSLIYIFSYKSIYENIVLWVSQPMELQFGLIVVFLFFATFFSYLLDMYLLTIMRLWEGYWEGNWVLGRFYIPKKIRYTLERDLHLALAELLEKEEVLCDIQIKDIILGTNLSTEIDPVYAALEEIFNQVDAVAGKICGFYPCFSQADGDLSELETKKRDVDKSIKELEDELLDAVLPRWSNSDLPIITSLYLPAANLAGRIEGMKPLANSLASLCTSARPDLAAAEMRCACLGLMSSLNDLEKKSKSLIGSLNETKERKEAVDKSHSAEDDPSKKRTLHSIMLLQSNAVSMSQSLEEIALYGEKIESTVKDMQILPSCIFYSDFLNYRIIIKYLLNDLGAIVEHLASLEKRVLDYCERAETMEAIRLKDVRQRKSIIEQVRAAASAYANSFPKNIVMATRFGNALRAAEEYPYLRYGIDPITFWPRFYPLFSQEFSSTLASSRSTMEAMIVISTLGIVLSLLGGLCLIVIIKAEFLHSLLVLWSGLAIGWLGYKGAVASAEGYGIMISTAFDLYRDKLMAELGLKMPSSIEEEKQMWSELEKFISMNIPLQSPLFAMYALDGGSKK